MATTTYVSDYAGITPDVLAGFATKHGWKLVPSTSRFAQVYADDHGAWVSIPISSDFADYDLRVEQFIDTFAQSTGSDAREVHDRLLLADWDIIRFRGIGGTDPFVGYRAGRKLVAGSEKALLAIACSLIDDSGAYSEHVKSKARKLIDGVKLGQTERGSFVVKVLVPSGPRPFDALDDQLKREIREVNSVGLRLASALSSTRLLLNGADFDSVADVVESGASAELCDAIGDMVQTFDAVETSFDWSGRPDGGSVPSPTTFSSADYEPLKSTSKMIKVASVQRADASVIRGFVRELHRTNQAATVGEPGAIELEWKNDGKTLTAKCELSDSDYAVAVDAHKNQRKIAIEGRLTGSGRTSRIVNGVVVDSGAERGEREMPLIDFRSVPDSPPA